MSFYRDTQNFHAFWCMDNNNVKYILLTVRFFKYGGVNGCYYVSQQFVVCNKTDGYKSFTGANTKYT